MSEPIRGQIYWVEWDIGVGSEQAGRRQGLIVQNDSYNMNKRYANTVVVALSKSGNQVHAHVKLEPDSSNGLRDTTYVKCEQLLTISKGRLGDLIGEVSGSALYRVDVALKKVLGIF